MAQMNDEQQPFDDNEDVTGGMPHKPYRKRKPRSMLWMLGCMLLLAVLAIAGIATAIISHTHDPAAIQLPDHTKRSLADDQPAPKFGEESGAPQTDIPPDLLEDALIPGTEGQEDETPMLLDRQSPVPPVEKPAILEPEKNPVSPQSMIIWDKPEPRNTANRSTTGKMRPVISIVIDDMGLNIRNSKILAAMTSPLTLAYLPYADNLPAQTREAYAKGHELIVHMPMEPDNIARNNPGPNALLASLTPEENLLRLQHNLGQFDGYIGLNNHMGSRLTADAKAMRPILMAVKQKNLWFLDSKTIGNSVAGQMAKEIGIPYAERDVFLDNVPNINAVLAQLRQVEQVAAKRGYAIAIGHPHDATLAALQAWMPTVQNRGFKLVPLSTIISRRFPESRMPRYARTETTAESQSSLVAASY